MKMLAGQICNLTLQMGDVRETDSKLGLRIWVGIFFVSFPQVFVSVRFFSKYNIQVFLGGSKVAHDDIVFSTFGKGGVLTLWAISKNR